MNATTAWAKFYGRANWRSFPVWPSEKRPMYAGWQKDASSDPALLDQYFRDPNRNLGIVCGEAFDAWDIESEHVARFVEWCADRPDPLPEAPIATSGRGGLHILTRPTGIDHTRKLYLDGTHIGELKSRGGFILACPSVTEQMYRWTWLPDRLALPVAPTWLLDLVREPAKARRGPIWPQVSLAPQADLAPLLVAVRRSEIGDRNANLHWAANRACDDGVPFEMAQRELTAAFMTTRQSSEDAWEYEQAARASIASAYNR